MSPDDPRHGTTRGHAAGCRQTCCREARNLDEARRRKYRQVLGITRSVDATGTRRRIQALMALGWPGHAIAGHCGWRTGEAVFEITRRNWVQRSTAEAVAHVYEHLSMTPGPSAQTRARAARMGWPPPLAWDDIDNPDEQPDVSKSARRTNADLLAEYAYLTAAGESAEQAARQLGVTLGAIEKARERERKVA